MEYLVSGALVVAEQFIVDVAALPAGSREQLVEALADEKAAMPRHLKDSFFRTGGFILTKLINWRRILEVIICKWIHSLLGGIL